MFIWSKSNMRDASRGSIYCEDGSILPTKYSKRFYENFEAYNGRVVNMKEVTGDSIKKASSIANYQI